MSIKYQIIILDMKVNQQQRKRIDSDERGNPIMTLKTIKYFCYKDCLYQTPELNEKLYLHYKGFKKIESLQNYPNLVTIWLSNNCISKIEGLNSLTNLICLYLNSNSISKIQNLQGLDKLSILHLAHNKIDKIEGLGCLKSLNFLNISQNFLGSPQSIIGLKQSSSLTSIDLSKNQLQNSNELFNIIASLQNIQCLTLKNTLLSKSCKNYRKRLISSLKRLKYLDDRPVKQIDHRLAEAWTKGGPDQQNQERIKILAEVEEKNLRQNKKLNEKILKQNKRDEQIKYLEGCKKQLLQQEINQDGEDKIKQINRRLDILRDGPKGFQANITNTSIKILNVKQQDQEQIINKYFFNEKKKIQDNLKKMQTQQITIQQVNLEQDEQIIQKKVRKVLGIANVASIDKSKVSLRQRWNPKNQKILQALLFKHKFNFSEVLPHFNRLMAQIHKKLMKSFTKFQLSDLQHIWTEVQMRRRKQHKADT